MEKMAILLKEEEIAKWLGLSLATIRRTRTANPSRHPPYKKLGSAVRYDPVEVQKWLDSKTVNGLDDPSPPAKAEPTKQTHRGAPTKAERVTKAKNAEK
ncbi:MAG: helix-turn-helix domain-containing protein [Nitrospirae bacterium]|nr:helix-turn-helix domain-containing protein [Nitrospirota bacterium]